MIRVTWGTAEVRRCAVGLAGRARRGAAGPERVLGLHLHCEAPQEFSPDEARFVQRLAPHSSSW